MRMVQFDMRVTQESIKEAFLQHENRRRQEASENLEKVLGALVRTQNDAAENMRKLKNEERENGRMDAAFKRKERDAQQALHGVAFEPPREAAQEVTPMVLPLSASEQRTCLRRTLDVALRRTLDRAYEDLVLDNNVERSNVERSNAVPGEPLVVCDAAGLGVAASPSPSLRRPLLEPETAGEGQPRLESEHPEGDRAHGEQGEIVSSARSLRG